MDLIINFTPTGMASTKELTPFVPISPDEVIGEVARAVETGITMVRLHARDARTKKPTYRADVYAELIEGIRSVSQDLVICVSLNGGSERQFSKRAEPLNLEGKLKPDMGSLTLSSLNSESKASLNEPITVPRLAHRMLSRGIVPELEVFDIGMINYAKYLEQKGLLQKPHYFSLLVGSIAGAQCKLSHVGLMIDELPEGSVWNLAGLGQAQLPMNSVGIAIGGGVRVGLEDNIFYNEARTRLASNLELLKRIHELAQVQERRVMEPSGLRQLLSLRDGCGVYGRDVTSLESNGSRANEPTVLEKTSQA